jgi:tRNA 2-thiouridine synthesizing protein A
MNTTTHRVDARGLACPLPVVTLAKTVRTLDQGSEVELLATDPGAVQDIPSWCRATGNLLVETDRVDGVFRFVIRKR